MFYFNDNVQLDCVNNINKLVWCEFHFFFPKFYQTPGPGTYGTTTHISSNDLNYHDLGGQSNKKDLQNLYCFKVIC